MDELHGDRSFSDRRGYPFDGGVTHVAHRQYAG
jgi:hypothetical protein